MAKSGTITATAGSNAALKLAVAQSDPRVSSLGSVVADALTEWPTQAIFIVDTKARKVLVCDPVAAVNTAVAALAPLERDDFTPVEAKKSTTWNAVNVQDGPLFGAMTAIVAPRPTTYTIASLISAIEDAALAAGKDVVIVIDQTNSTVQVWAGSPAQVDAEDIAAAVLAVPANVFAEFTQTVESSTGPKDPFE
jgi:hypothetical protein